ncbi:MAG: hypothetical protein LBL47_02395, partial [Lactobacillus sp.]|nr:hypothetical protein [Lactobacillus sp.]
EIYGGVKITVDGTEFEPKVADWEFFGTGKDNVSYKVMDMARGHSLASDKMALEDKKLAAKAYVTNELYNLLRGDVWDIDRHIGQQNFAKTENDGLKKFVIGIFDTGAQMKNAPDKKDKVMLGEMLYGVIRAARTGKPIDEYMFSKLKRLDKLNNVKISTNYIADVQKGLTALSDIMEYQKELKDKDGNIIQNRETLDGKDLADIVEAVLAAPEVDKTVKNTLATKVVLNKLRPFRKGWAESLGEGLNKNTNNSIKIEHMPFDGQSKSKQFDKPLEEINKIEKGLAEERILGINKKNLKENEENASSTNSRLLGMSSSSARGA